jgi:hypothetical protein
MPKPKTAAAVISMTATPKTPADRTRAIHAALHEFNKALQAFNWTLDVLGVERRPRTAQSELSFLVICGRRLSQAAASLFWGEV